jgi:anti-sigma-K factor RskA
MGRSEHDDFREQAALYVIGSLPFAERTAFEAHLSGCSECASELRSLLPVRDALALAVPQLEPPPGLRDRVLASMGGPSRLSSRSNLVVSPPRRTRLDWLVAAVSLAALLGLGVYTAQLRDRVNSMSEELRAAIARADASDLAVADARRTAADAQASVGVLSAPDAARVDLTGQPPAPRASARAYWSRSRGLVFTASDLPALPTGRTYQLWVVPAGAPISVGLLRPDAGGRATARFDTAADLPQPVAMAVTIEPDGGVPAPTGDKYLVGAVSSR